MPNSKTKIDMRIFVIVVAGVLLEAAAVVSGYNVLLHSILLGTN